MGRHLRHRENEIQLYEHGFFSGGYGWKNTPYQTEVVSSTDFTVTKYTKYVQSGQSSWWRGGGSPDNKTVLESVDDAATTANGNWRMPTREDYQNLCQHTNLQVVDGVNQAWIENFNGSGENGAKVISKFRGYADNYIFFPALGNFGTIVFNKNTERGEYLSSSLSSSSTNPNYVTCMSLNSIGVNRQYNAYRYNGRSIRAVYNN